ncbi:hypothetical protein PIB30_010385 [Stylosanthes scabra]|uniref:Uncharacterized protein n=1 Tax=Stylosanthes scabra TaxID=79078 RepID=A0ABU6W4X6_9FABA|nr:hypothetical protein [Stylosanthes scabra]
MKIKGHTKKRADRATATLAYVSLQKACGLMEMRGQMKSRVMMNFSMDRIKTVMKFGGPLNTKTSYRIRMVPANHEMDAVIRDLCVEGSIWGLGAQNTQLYLKRTDLNPIARGCHEFIIHNILPSTNQSEVTLNSAPKIHHPPRDSGGASAP